jgi:CubicO group peptidase (beta-lactamase class C family)
METWLALIVAAVGVLLTVHERHGDAPAPEPAGRAIRDAFGPVARVGRRRGAGAADRPRGSHRAEPAGLSVAVGVGGDIVWAEGFGWADLENRVPVAPDTRFRIGTASKVLTSAAVGLLLEKGRLKLDDEIQTYVPAFPEKQWPVTLRQLMGHVAGVRNDGGDEGPLLSARCERPVEALQHFAERSLLFEPGTSTAIRATAGSW